MEHKGQKEPDTAAADKAVTARQFSEIAAKSSLLRSSLLVGTMTMLSRVLGLARDVVVANYFGASGSADAFFVAFKIPNFLRRLFAEGAFAQAFVPVFKRVPDSARSR